MKAEKVMEILNISRTTLTRYEKKGIIKLKTTTDWFDKGGRHIREYDEESVTAFKNSMADKKKPLGLKKYDDINFPKLAYKAMLVGASIPMLAEFFSVNEQTINSWRNKYPAFGKAISQGKEIADMRVAKSLYKRATGYELDSEEIKVLSDGMFGGSYIEKVPVTKHYPADVKAAIFWLTNRQPQAWSEKQKIEHSGQVTNYNVELTKEEAAQINKMLEENY